MEYKTLYEGIDGKEYSLSFSEDDLIDVIGSLAELRNAPRDNEGNFYFSHCEIEPGGLIFTIKDLQFTVPI